MKNIFYLLFTLFITIKIYAQTTNSESLNRPKLVVGIVVDQMRYDYLYRFYSKYGNGGFKRLMKEGYNCKNTHFNYVPTYTAVGHTSIYTGTTPSEHGIIGNDWYDKKLAEKIYCVNDKRYITVGAKKGGQKSPYRLQVTTITDELKLAIKTKSKVIGISLKDRSAILPAGHAADAAYWFRGKKDAKFITSSFYMDKLPKWVTKFNKSNIAKNYVKTWNTLYNIDTYTESIEDNNNFEQIFKGEKTPTFPHDLPKIMSENGNYNILKATPFGNSLLVDFAKATIQGEQLGKDTITDFLTISFSSTDYIGHRFGPDSVEIEDTYLRLDKDLENLLNYLDTNIGENEYSLFLTADHAVAHNPSYLKSLKINAGYFNFEKYGAYLNNEIYKKFKIKNTIKSIYNDQVFLNYNTIDSLGLNINVIAEFIKNKSIIYDGIYKVFTAETILKSNYNSSVLGAIKNGYNQKFSGDVIISLMPGVLYKKMKGTSHGTAYNYDTHVPLIFFGKGFSSGEKTERVEITDIAPTIANLLNISFPSASKGKVIQM